MRIIRILAIIVFITAILSITVKGVEPEITANSAVVIDCIDGRILYNKNMDEKLYPASMTKILTAILVVENSNMQDQVTVTQSAINNVQSGYLTANIKEGEILSIEQLLNLLLISSYNDVSNVLAEHIGGNMESFIVMMNQKAKEIGCTNSSFSNNSGEHDENHYSTAHDMALIGKYAMQYDEIKDIVKKIYYELGATNKYEKTDRLYQTTNEMLLSGSSNYYKYAKGLKTGFTTPAGHCLIAYAEKNDIPLIAVVMKSTTSDSRYEDTKKIFEYAFENNTIKQIAQAGMVVQTLNIKNANKSTKKLNAILEKDINSVVNIEKNIENIKPKIIINENLKAPIKKGATIGTVEYEVDGKIYTSNLIAESDVEKSNKVLTFTIVFIGIITFLGGLRIFGLYKRTKILKKIRGKK